MFVENLRAGMRPGGPLDAPTALGADSLVVDSNISLAQSQNASGVALDPGRAAALRTFQAQGAGDVRMGPTTVGEVPPIPGQGVGGIRLSVPRTSPEYQRVLTELRTRGIGGNPSEAAPDQALLTDLFFAETEAGTTPRLLTQDTRLYTRLADWMIEEGALRPYKKLKLPGGGVEKNTAAVAREYAGGFNVTINGRTIRIIPAPVL
jgi:hypothetical protein